MSQSRWWFVRIVVKPRRDGPDPGWRPTMIFFECDDDVKGVALFTSRVKAEEFAGRMAMTLPHDVAELGGESVRATVKDYVLALVSHIGTSKKALAMPVYVDPPDDYCKGKVSPTFKSLERFFLKHKQCEVPYEYDLVGFGMHKGYTIMLLKHANGASFVAQTMKGEFTDRESMSIACEDAIGTTDERHYNRTAPMADPDEALLQAQRFVDKLAEHTI